jgi:hypothetical protein
MCTWVVKGQPAYIRNKKKIFPQMYATVSKTTLVHPQKHSKIKCARVNSPLNFSCNRMYVHWRERKHEEIDVLVDEDPVSISALKQCGLWKFY